MFLINSNLDGFPCHPDTPRLASEDLSSYPYRITRISSRCEYMDKGAAVRAARTGQGAARFSHYVPRLFEILTVQCAHPAQGVAITTTTAAAAAVHGRNVVDYFAESYDEGACEKVELRRRAAPMRAKGLLGNWSS